MWGYIDRTGRFTIAPRFDAAGAFQNGKALVQLDGEHRWLYQNGRLGRKWCWTSRRRKLVPWQYERANLVMRDRQGRAVKVWTQTSAEGLSVAYPDRGKSGREEGPYGFFDRRRRVIIKPRFVSVRGFSQGLAAVAVGGRRNRCGDLVGARWGFIDTRGRFVIEPQFRDVGSFCDGRAPVNFGERAADYGVQVVRRRFRQRSYDGGKPVSCWKVFYRNWGLIDREGRVIAFLEAMYGPGERVTR
jgi:hypothetical protein